MFNLRASLETRLFAYVKTKAQVSCAVTAQLISAFVFAKRIVQSLYFLNFIHNFKPLAILSGCTAWFVSDLVGNPEDWFSHTKAHKFMSYKLEVYLFESETITASRKISC